MYDRNLNSSITARLGLTVLIGLAFLGTVAAYGQDPTAATGSAATGSESAAAADPSGTWKWDREFGDNILHSTLVLKKEDGGKLSGTLQTVFNDGDGPGSEAVEIDNAKIDGDKVTFSVTRSFNNNEFTIDYTGTYKNGQLEGTYTLDFGNGPREIEWIAKRSVDVDALVGKWNLKFEGPNGQAMESSMTIKKEGQDKLAGTYHSQFFGDAPMTELALKDGKLAFVVVFNSDNGEFPISYAGQPMGDSMKGTITTEFNGQKNETPFEAKLEKEAAQENSGDDSQQAEEATTDQT